MEECKLCNHSLENNSHGFDQNYAWMDEDKIVHGGFCSYCKICFPIDLEKLKQFKEKYEKFSS